MPHAPFDPTRAVTFDLSLGQVHLQDKEPTAIVPAAALGELCASAGEQTAKRFGRAMGQAIGKRVAARLAGESGPGSYTVEGFLEHLGGELALSGLGVLRLERWGRAMVFVIERSGIPTGIAGALLEGALQQATGRDARCVRLMHEEHRERYLITSEQGAGRVLQLLAQGTSWGEVLVSLHGAQKAPGARGDA